MTNKDISRHLGTPSITLRPGLEIVQNGYRPTGAGGTQGGHQPTTGQGAPSNPPNEGSGGKK